MKHQIKIACLLLATATVYACGGGTAKVGNDVNKTFRVQALNNDASDIFVLRDGQLAGTEFQVPAKGKAELPGVLYAYNSTETSQTTTFAAYRGGKLSATVNVTISKTQAAEFQDWIVLTYTPPADANSSGTLTFVRSHDPQ